MPYGEILSRAARIVLRHRYLWLLGFFGGGEAGAAGGFFPGFPAGPGGASPQPTSPEPSQFEGIRESIGDWVADHLALIALVLIVALLVGVILFLISVIASGAIVRAGAELDAGRAYRLGQAWSAGAQLFWPVFVLKLLAFLFYLFPLVVGGLIIALIIVSSQVTPAFLLLFLALLPLFFLYLLYALAVQIVMTLTLRAVVLDGKRVLAGIVSTIALLRRRLGRVALTWLMLLAVGLGIGIGVLVALLLLLIPLGLLVLIGWLAARGPGLIITGVLAGFLGIACLLILVGAASSYNSTAWTLAYRRFDAEASSATAPPPLPA